MIIFKENEGKNNGFYPLWHRFRRVTLFSILCILPNSLFAQNNVPSDTSLGMVNKKLQGRQLVVEAEKPGEYRVGILVSSGIDFNEIENSEERSKKKREIHYKVIQALSGKITLYDFHYRTQFQEIKLPSKDNAWNPASEYLIDEELLGASYDVIEISRTGHYIFRPEIISQDLAFTDYTLIFEPVGRSTSFYAKVRDFFRGSFLRKDTQW